MYQSIELLSIVRNSLDMGANFKTIRTELQKLAESGKFANCPIAALKKSYRAGKDNKVTEFWKQPPG